MRTQHGISLIDALVALLLLSLGMLTLVHFAGRMVAHGTDAQSRLLAAQAGDELLSTALVDVANAACYTLPQHGACASAAAKQAALDWQQRTTAVLQGGTADATLDDGRLTVTIRWTGQDGPGESRQLETQTDVRP